MAGRVWVADFDLAAFYETISHDLLLRVAYPRHSSTEDITLILDWLRLWGSPKTSVRHGHGIPQGPIASDFLAECFLLPVDKALGYDASYVRFVDDVRLFGRTEDEVRALAIRLEFLCRERGLIPQVGKFAIKRAHSVRDALGMLPSISDPNDSNVSPRISGNTAVALFKSSLEGRTHRIVDKTRARYALYRSEPTPRILTYALRLWPRHPEHTDAFVQFLSQYAGNKRIRDSLCRILQSTPYEYVRGEVWHLLAKLLQRHNLIPAQLRRRLLTMAIESSKSSGQSFALKWGALHFLCTADSLGHGRFAEWARFQASGLLQAILAPIVPSSRFTHPDAKGILSKLLSRSTCEPGLALVERFVEYGRRPSDFGIIEGNLPSQVTNVMAAVGILGQPKRPVDPIDEIISRRYTIPSWNGWRLLLGGKYVYSLGLLAQSDAVYHSGPSRWLAFQNAFNQTLFLALQAHLTKRGLPGEVKISNSKGELISFGVTLDPRNRFSMAYPRISTSFRTMNHRRNRLPLAHPYDMKTGSQNKYLKPRERNILAANLKEAYKDFAGVPV